MLNAIYSLKLEFWTSVSDVLRLKDHLEIYPNYENRKSTCNPIRGLQS